MPRCCEGCLAKITHALIPENIGLIVTVRKRAYPHRGDAAVWWHIETASKTPMLRAHDGDMVQGKPGIHSVHPDVWLEPIDDPVIAKVVSEEMAA